MNLNETWNRLNQFIDQFFSKKIFKRELKGNVLLNISLALRHLILLYKNYILIGAGALVVILVLIALSISRYETKVNEANKWFEASLSQYRRAFLEKKMTPEERYQALQESINRFQYVVTTFSGTPLEYDSLMYQGNAYFELGDYPNALQKYQQLIDKKSSYYFADFILINIAKCYEQLNNIQAAVDTYNRVLTQYKKKSNTAYAMFNLAKIYELTNKVNEAFQLYQQLFQQYPNSIW
jgi:tetratricopeptide (TPR) repeat protein